MQVADRLYIDELIKKRKGKRLVKSLKKNKKVEGYYVLYYNEDRKNPLEVIRSEELYKEYYKEQKLTLVGLATDDEEALTLVEHIISDMVQVGISFNDRSFFKFIV